MNVNARFARAAQFSAGRKMGCREKPDNDEIGMFRFGKIPLRYAGHAMMSGNSVSSIFAIWSFNCSLRFFSRLN
jgi:hypothetical protein